MGKKKHQRSGGIRLEFKQNDAPKNHQNGHTHRTGNGIVANSSKSNSTVPSSTGTSVNIPEFGELDYESSLERQIVKVHDKDSLQSCLRVWDNTLKERAEFYSENINYSCEDFEFLIRTKKLDSNLTKCSKFAKKLRQYSFSQTVSLEGDLKTLNLSKYLSEIASSLAEARFKLADVSSIVTICAELRRRYADISSALLENYRRVLMAKKAEMASIAKITVDLRIYSELLLSGIITVQDGFPLLMMALRNLMATVKDATQCVVPFLYLCRAVGFEISGIVPKNIRKLCDKHNMKLAASRIVTRDRKEQMQVLLKEFYATLTKTLISMHEESLLSEMINRRHMKTRGELTPDRIEAHAEITSRLEKFLLNVKKMAYILDCDVPELRTLPAADPDEEKEKPMLNEDGQEVTVVPGIVLFDDEETRSFYQDFPDLKVYLPPVAYRDTLLQSAKEAEAIAEREKEVSNVDEEIEKAELKSFETAKEEMAETEENELPPSMRAATEEEKDLEKDIKPLFKIYLETLKNCVNRNMIDKAAFEFVEKFNNKQNRKKLAKTIFHIPRQRVDLLPLWARLVAILSPVMPDISIELNTMLMKDFQYLLRKKHQIFIETKLKITRLIAELVNFRVFPKADALHCFKLLLMDFVHHQIEMCCAFVETCGRFLHRSTESHRKTKIYLEEMIRKKKVKALEPRYLNLVDHAYAFVVAPKEVVAPKAKQLPALEAFIQCAVWYELDKTNLEKTIEILRCLDWTEEIETMPSVVRTLSNPCETSYTRLPYIASLISGLSEYKSEVGVKVLDKVLEEIKIGMENNNVILNQRRFTMCSFLGQLYLYRVASAMQIFTTLYDLITYGVSNGKLRRGNVRRLHEHPNDLFRIRLACQILKICGEYFNHGSTRKALDAYVRYLQRYYWYKRSNPYWSKRKTRFPYGIREDMEETIKRIHPATIIYKNWDEANADVKLMEKQLADKVRAVLQSSGYDEVVQMKYLPEEMKLLLAAETQRQNAMEPVRQCNSSNEMHRNPPGTKSSAELPMIEDPYAKYEITHPMDKENREEEAFQRELDRLCSQVNYSASRDGGKHMTSTIPIPLNIRNDDAVNNPTVQDGASAQPQEETVNFTLITRKGNKQQYKTLPVPVTSDFAVKLKNREEAERAEKERVKMITLGMNDLQVAEEEEQLLLNSGNVRARKA